MALTGDLIATYRAPRAVMRHHLAMGVREDRALIYLIAACVLIFVSRWPGLQRQAFLDESVPLEALLGGALLGWLFIAPLALYAIAALSHLAARAIGGQGSGFGARLALFWALLAASPLWLLNGLVAGFIGPGIQLTLTGALALAVFVLFWGINLHQAEFSKVPA